MANPNPIIIKKLGGSGPGSSSSRGSRPPPVRIPGVFPSVRFGEQVVSTGIPSLDNSIGGGVPLGSILLIQDSFMCTYADVILKCFLAEGASYSHYMFMASGKTTPGQFIQELPSIKREAGQGDNPSSSAEDMKIAWRYHQGVGGGILKTPKKSKFEFKKRTSVEELGGQSSRVTLSQVLEINANAEDLNSPIGNYMDILKEIAACVLALPPSGGILRIGISHCEEHVLSSPQFIAGLRALVRNAPVPACAVITLSTLSSESMSKTNLQFCEQFSDTVIHLQLILDEDKKAELGDIDALCKITKLASINSLKLVASPRDLGLIFRKRQIMFQELHLPPEGENTVQREVSTSKMNRIEQASSASSGGCGTTVQGKSIDF